MKILTSTQISEWDKHTMEVEQISSIDLMERAAQRLSAAVESVAERGASVVFFIGRGNNGGDGLAMARILANIGYDCRVVPLFPDRLNENCHINMQRLPQSVKIEKYPYYPEADAIVIDAILGSGLCGDVDETTREIIRFINRLPNRKISVDLPSGMHTEWDNNPEHIVHADLTLTIEAPKLSFMFSEAGDACGRVQVVGIGLDKEFARSAITPYHYVDDVFVDANKMRLRAKFSHKGNYGHALLVCGSKGMVGAAVLATGGALRSGCGYVSTLLPERYVSALVANYPSALTIGEENDYFGRLPDNLERYNAIAVGCGIGQNRPTAEALGQLLKTCRCPMVIDADAINILAANTDLLNHIPKNSVLTPHIGELRHLIGRWGNCREMTSKSSAFALKYNVVLAVKGAHTMICLPNGEVWFNSTGNAFMAKAGAGDVLTGLIAGLMARGYEPHIAAMIGVYHHGKAGELAAKAISGESFCSNDLINFIFL